MTENIPLSLPKNAERLEAEIGVVVPSTKGVKTQRIVNNTEMNKRVNDVRKYLSKIFGGYTSVNAVGGYVMKRGNKLVQEDVVIVTSFGDSGTARDKIKQNKLLNKMKRWTIEWNQESTGLLWENDFIRISRK